MATDTNPLDSVKVASPCSVDWEDMIGTDRRRFCGQCELNVYNLSEMTKRDAENLVNQVEGRVCVRFFKRADGTILTTDCPVGLKAIKRQLSRIRIAVVSAVLSFLAGVGVQMAGSETEPPVMMGTMVAPEQVMETPLPISDSEPEAVMGGVQEVTRKTFLMTRKKTGKRGGTKLR